mmetsp:Transcript_96343/g.311083  ORF Transcript_96343/g.311083 Transcript_96343/m.311083 type:complete len:306 (+) Transcript_96343:322-1239(+)
MEASSLESRRRCSFVASRRPRRRSVSEAVLWRSSASCRRSARSSLSSRARRSTSPSPAPVPRSAGPLRIAQRMSSRTLSQSAATWSSAFWLMAATIRERSALSFASSWAKQAVSSSTLRTWCASPETSLLILRALPTAPSRTSARLTNFADRSFICALALVADSRPLFSACSSVAKRRSHCSESTARRACCCFCCSSRHCWSTARAVPVPPAASRPSALASPASECRASAAERSAAARSKLGWLPLPSCSVNRGTPFSNADVWSKAPCTASLCTSSSMSRACLWANRFSLPGEPGPRLLLRTEGS